MSADFENLEVWKKSCRLCIDLYSALKSCKDLGMYSQITRSAVSIPSNIAEGAERKTVKEFANFLYIAKGSSAELRTQLYLTRELGYIPRAISKKLILESKEITKMLQGLINSLDSQTKKTDH
ncbi:MAG: four helix bundle protein [Lentisphaeria bacterium]|nr:four helix bundle protein [Lentisphaeria bacterium]